MTASHQEFDALFADRPDMRFRAEARRNRLLGLWAAERMGLAGTEAEAYARSVNMADLEEAGDEDVLRKVAADLAERGVELPGDGLRAHMDALLAEAKTQLVAEGGRTRA